MTTDNDPGQTVQRRVTLVSPVGTIGGGEEVLLALAERLPAYGYEADFVCLRPGPLHGAARRLGVHAEQGVAHRMRDLGAVRAARKWLGGLFRQRRPAVVHCNHMAHLYGHGPARRAGAREVWHVHDYPHRLDWADRLGRLVPADHIVFTTPFVRNGYPLLRRRFAHSVIPPAGAELPLTSAPNGGTVRTRLGLPANGPLFLTVARLQRHKGHAVLLEAARRLLAVEPAAVFVVTGEATDAGQAEYLAELRRVAVADGVGHAVHFVGRVIDQDLSDLLAASAALVHPALTEGFGLALVHALRRGVPVVAADAEGPQAVLDDGRLGRLVPRGDAVALADALVALISRPPTPNELGRIADTAAARYSADAMTRQIARVYDGLVPALKGNECRPPATAP